MNSRVNASFSSTWTSASTAEIRRFTSSKMIDSEFPKWWQSSAGNVALTRPHKSYCNSSLLKQLLRSNLLNDIFLHITNNHHHPVFIDFNRREVFLDCALAFYTKSRLSWSRVRSMRLEISSISKYYS